MHSIPSVSVFPPSDHLLGILYWPHPTEKRSREPGEMVSTSVLSRKENRVGSESKKTNRQSMSLYILLLLRIHNCLWPKNVPNTGDKQRPQHLPSIMLLSDT